jgi:urease subunit beta
MIPGEYILKEDKIVCNEGYETIEVPVVNTGDRAVQVGAFFHFYEVNSALSFDRELAKGKRLDIPSGNTIRFEPGEKRVVKLINYGGKRRVFGFNDKIDGFLD